MVIGACCLQLTFKFRLNIFIITLLTQAQILTFSCCCYRFLLEAVASL